MVSAKPAIDRIDRKILRALQRDGRMTNQQLAEQVALSPSACLARVRRLEDAGVITGYRAQVDPTQLGSCLVVFAEIAAVSHDLAVTKRLEATLRDMPEAIEAYQVSGDYDFLIRFLVEDMDEWTQIADALAGADLQIKTIKTVASMRVLKGWNGIPIDLVDRPPGRNRLRSEGTVPP